ncbi:hypothetical protein AB0I50_47995, partial [Streptomyces prunicolor]
GALLIALDVVYNHTAEPGDGNCLLYAVIGSAPHLVRTRLQQADPVLAPRTAAWLARPDEVRQTLTTLAADPETDNLATAHLEVVQQGLRNLVLARLVAAGDGSRPLPPQVLGQLRGVLADGFAGTVRNMADTDVDNGLARYGIQGMTQAEDLDPADLQARYLQAVSTPGAPPAPAGNPPSNRQLFAYLRAVDALPTLTDMTPDERRSLLTAGYHRSTAPLTAYEAGELGHAVSNWSTEWENPLGDTFLPLLADTLDVPIHVFQPVSDPLDGVTATVVPQGIVLRYGPTTNTPALEVHYTGLNHYSASNAGLPTLTPPNAPRGPEDANSVQPKGRYRPAPTRDAADDRPASHVADPAPKDTWFGLRPHARAAVHSTERFDAHADQSNAPRPGVLSGATTLVRTQVRRIQAPNGTWVRDYTLNLPVTTTDPARARQLQDRITGLLDTHLNSGLALPGSGDQLHINLNLIDDPAHPEAITLTDSANPARADQLHLDMGHSDEDLLHEVLHYLGLPDEQRDNDFLLRNHPNSTTVHTTGLMATTQTPVHIPHRYLRTIENVTASGPQLHDHTGQDETTPALDPDTTPIPADTAPTWPTSNAPVAAPSSTYVLAYGSQLDGNVGLVFLEPLSAAVVNGLHQQVMTALGLQAAPDTHPVREQLRTVASAEALVLNLPYLRGSLGFRITLRVDGRDRDVDLRMRLANPVAAARYGQAEGAERDVRVERRGIGSQESVSSEASGNIRTLMLPWTALFPVSRAIPVRGVDVALTLALTLNQLSSTASVTTVVQSTTAQRSNEPSEPYDFTALWDVRLDTPALAAPVTWGATQAHGPVTFWFPQHLARDEEGELPAAAGLDVLPVWGVDTVAEPGRLLAEALQHFDAQLRTLDGDSLAELETFLSEPLLRGTLPMQRDRGVFSPVLLDGSGRAVGMFQLLTDVEVGEPLRRSVPGKINLESHLMQVVKIDAQSRFSSGVSLSGSVGPAFTGDHTEGHPDASRRPGGGLLGRASVQAATNGALTQSGSAALMHAVRTNRSHLLAPAQVHHTLVLHLPGGGRRTFEPGDWPRGMHLRVLTAEDAQGHAPSEDELRLLPAELEHLRAIGTTATPLEVQGTEPLFVHAENWLRREGFLPGDTTARNRVLPDEALVQAQLNNLRRFEQTRSQVGQRAAADAMVDGGHSLFLEIPTVSGTRRVRLVLSAVRGAGGSTHTTVLPDVQGIGLSSLSTVATDQNGSQYGASYGGGGSFGLPVRDGAWTVGGTGDHVRSHQVQHDNSAQLSLGHDQQFIGSGAGQRSEVFEVPADLALDLYEGPGEEPLVRFAHETVQQPYVPHGAPQPGPNDPPPPPPPDRVPGALRLSVPTHRTLPADEPVPVAPGAHTVRAATDADRTLLDLTDAAGAPLPDSVPLPDDAMVEVFQASAALDEAFRAVLGNTYTGHPARGLLDGMRDAVAERTPAPVARVGRAVGESLAGAAATDPTTVTAEMLTALLLSPSRRPVRSINCAET